MKLKLSSRTNLVVFAAVGIVAAGGIGYAAIPGTDGQIKGCYAHTNGILLGIPHSKGDLRIVDEGESCRSYETTLKWNQKGLKGDTGAAGPSGPMGTTGPTGADGLDGATGPTGPQGPMGSVGPAGAIGPEGPQGPEGSKGATGATGPAGPAGPASVPMSAYDSLQGSVEIPELHGGAPDLTVLSVTLTSGSWSVMARGQVSFFHFQQEGTAVCAFARGQGTLDYERVSNGDRSGADGFTLLTVITVTTTERIDLTCSESQGNIASLFSGTLLATRLTS